ncbi:hypothetical protein [Pseudomonas phage D6]|nr:hypothetical protein [Pseudomonas phage D6]
MFKSFVNKCRLDALLSQRDFKTWVPYFRHEEHRDMFLVVKNGEPVFYHKGSLYPIPAVKVDLPKVSSFSWVPRNNETLTHWHKRAVALVNHLEMRTVGYDCGIHFMTWAGVEYYLKRDSDKGDWFVVYTRGGQAISFPTVMFREYRGIWYNDVHPYTAKIVDMCCGAEDSTYRTIVDVTNERVDPIGAYTRLVELENCPGVYDYLSYDVTININTLDNSGKPVVDLRPFIDAFRNHHPHNCTKWMLNVDEIKLQIGMMPMPVAIKDLDTELPDHRFFLSGTQKRLDEEQYYSIAGFDDKNCIYSGKLPTSFP